jgi:hypothetical protein
VGLYFAIEIHIMYSIALVSIWEGVGVVVYNYISTEYTYRRHSICIYWARFVTIQSLTLTFLCAVMVYYSSAVLLQPSSSSKNEK